MRCALPICLREKWRHQLTGWPRSMPMARSSPSAVFADPGDDRSSRAEKTSVFRATRLDSLVRRRGTGIRPPPLSRGKSQAITAPRPYRPGAARFQGSFAPSSVLDPGLRALTASVEFILRYCSTVFQPQCRQTARPRPERAAKASAAKRRKPALPHSAVGFSGAWWKTVVFGV